jgi:hypothetical protein
VFTQFVTNRDLCPHNLWQAGICVHTGCDNQGSVSTQVVTNRDLCSHNLRQTWIYVHTVYDKQRSVLTQFVINRYLCQTGICVHTVCDKQVFVSSQFIANKDMFPHNLWHTGICIDILSNCVDILFVTKQYKTLNIQIVVTRVCVLKLDCRLYQCIQTHVYPCGCYVYIDRDRCLWWRLEGGTTRHILVYCMLCTFILCCLLFDSLL